MVIMSYTFRIGSFNLHHLNKYDQKKLLHIASIISGEKFDIVALQEITDYDACKALCSLLNSNWGYCFTADKGGLGRSFIWCKNRISLIKDSVINGYHTDNKLHLQREPYYARFSPSGLGGPFMELGLINIHLLPKSNQHGNPKDEYKILEEKIYPKIAGQKIQHFKRSIMPLIILSYPIVLGDYNLTVNEIETINSNNNFITIQNRPTTISSTYDYYSQNDYDHFSYSQKRFQGFQIQCERVDAVGKYFGGDFSKYREQVSDHIPISIKIIFGKW